MKWKPDTCKCEINFDGNWDIPSQVKIKKCSVHLDLTDDAISFNKIYINENQIKNKFLGEVLKVPELRKEVIDEEGNINYKLKDGLKYNWSFDAKRKLQAEIIGLTNLEKSSLQMIIDTKLGLNKVDII